MLEKIQSCIRTLHPSKIIVFGYILYSFLGGLVLLIPICHNPTLPALDNFFTAISATTTTGLNTIDLGKEYTPFGHFVLFWLIQLGGIGYMTFSSFVVLATTDKLSHFRKKMFLTSFPLPKDFSIRDFVMHVAAFTAICEIVGAIALSWLFMNRGVENYVWQGIFHSVSAFCTAGLSLFPNGFVDFKYDVPVNMMLSILSILGSVGFIVCLDFYKKMTGSARRVTFTTKVILSVTFCFLGFGTLIVCLIEGAPQNSPAYGGALIAFFQIMNASTTAGFNSIDIGMLKGSSIVLFLFLMAFGASPSGTGGGLRSTTFAALIGLVKSSIKGRHTVSFCKRKIPPKRLQLAFATCAYYLFVLILSVFLLEISENKPFLPVLFESASALGTVGLSMGITASLTTFGKALIALLMLMGKAGILTFGIAISTYEKAEKNYKEDNELVF